MSEVNPATKGAASPPAVDSGTAPAEQKPAEKAGKAKGKGCVEIKNPALARTAAAGRARADALRQVCLGGRPGQTAGQISGGIEHYFVEDGKTCAEGTFQVVCGVPNQSPAWKREEAAVAGKSGAAPEGKKVRGPKIREPLLTAADKAEMADLEAMMDEMRMR